MAYVPDDAIRRKRQLTPSAWDVYVTLCAFADPETGVVEGRFVCNKRLVTWTELSLGTVKNAMTELRQRGWVEQRGARLHLLTGTFLHELRRPRRLPDETPAPGEDAHPGPPLPGELGPVQPSLYGDSEAGAPSPYGDSGSLNGDLPSPYDDAPSPYSDAPSPYGDARVYKDRARGSTSPITSPPTSPTTNTHTPAPRAGGREAATPAGAAADAGVCVPMPKSRFRLEQVRAWAEQQKAEGGRINPYAVARARWLDGTADGDVASFLARLEQIQEGCRPVERQLTPYHVALQVVSSVAQAAGADVAGFIAGMQDVSEETRAKLRSRFLEAPWAEAVAGRAPP